MVLVSTNLLLIVVLWELFVVLIIVFRLEAKWSCCLSVSLKLFVDLCLLCGPILLQYQYEILAVLLGGYAVSFAWEVLA
jgi:hypothetical protein